MTSYQLAQINVARLKAPIDAPETADFAGALDRINALAESSPGFVWRLKGDGSDATDLVAFDDPTIITNMSVWESPAALGAFVYRSGHSEIMRRRAEWFHVMEVFVALWWVPAGHEPTLAEGVEKLVLLERDGPTPDAFTFREPHPAPDATTSPLPILDKCA
jgi:hypothetical protein